MDKTVIDNALVKISDLGLKLAAALAVWIVGRALIRFALNLLVGRLRARKLDNTIVGYARNTLAVCLNVALVVVLMGVLGIETTSFAAFIAGAGLAIGAAWGGLLSNLAAGAFLVVLRPFKAGDVISAAGATGTVTEIGLLVTSITTQDNVHVVIGNSKILGANLKNYNTNPSRRVDLTGTIRRDGDVKKTIEAVRERIAQVPNVLAAPAAEVRILSFNEEEYTLAIRPYAHNDHYWQVHFDVTEALQDLLCSLGMPAVDHAHGTDEGAEGAEAPEAEEGEEEEE